MVVFSPFTGFSIFVEQPVDIEAFIESLRSEYLDTSIADASAAIKPVPGGYELLVVYCSRAIDSIESLMLDTMNIVAAASWVANEAPRGAELPWSEAVLHRRGLAVLINGIAPLVEERLGTKVFVGASAMHLPTRRGNPLIPAVFRTVINAESDELASSVMSVATAVDRCIETGADIVECISTTEAHRMVGVGLEELSAATIATVVEEVLREIHVLRERRDRR